MTRQEFNEEFAKIETANPTELKLIIAKYHGLGICCEEHEEAPVGAIDPREESAKSYEETLLGLAEEMLRYRLGQ